MKDKKIFIFIGVFAMVAVIWFFSIGDVGAKSKTSTFDNILREGKINVCYINYPPMSAKNPETGEIEGHFIDTMDVIAKESDLDVNYIETGFSTFIVALETGRCDVSIVGAFKTIPRAKSIAFSRTLFYAGSSAVIRKDETRFNYLSDLNNEDIVVAVTQGEASHEFAKKYIPNAKLIIHSGDQSETFSEVLAGRADVGLGDFYAVKNFVEVHNEDARDLFRDEPFNLMPVGWSVRKSDYELLQFLDTSIESLEISGALQEFEKRNGITWIHK